LVENWGCGLLVQISREMSDKMIKFAEQLTTEELDEKDERYRWFAEAMEEDICLTRFTVVRKTPCGVWLSVSWGKNLWRKNGSRRATLTIREALKNLVFRKKSALTHAEHRRLDAKKQFSLALSWWEKIREKE
jgi:hypothetical protein